MSTWENKLSTVHVHYSCNCSHQPVINLDHVMKVANIDVTFKCPTHKNGKSIELIIGNSATEAAGCPCNHCDATSGTAQIALADFIGLLSADFVPHRH